MKVQSCSHVFTIWHLYDIIWLSYNERGAQPSGEINTSHTKSELTPTAAPATVSICVPPPCCSCAFRFSKVSRTFLWAFTFSGIRQAAWLQIDWVDEKARQTLPKWRHMQSALWIHFNWGSSRKETSAHDSIHSTQSSSFGWMYSKATHCPDLCGVTWTHFDFFCIFFICIISPLVN